MEKTFAVYILTNLSRTVFYTGVTSNLTSRIYQHKENLVEGFTKKYRVSQLVYYEICPNAETAICREKQIKDGSRKKKLDLINSMNPEWKDLYEQI